MAANSKIEWTDTTWNPVAGCTPVSPGCLNCYAATMAGRLEAMGQSDYVGLTVKHNGRTTFNGTIRERPDKLTDPLGWKKPRMVFVNSMSDLFHEDVSFDFVDKVFAVMALCPQHTFQVLTKRPDRMAEYLLLKERVNDLSGDLPSDDTAWRDWTRYDEVLRHVNVLRADGHGLIGGAMIGVSWPLPNVWLGTSVEDQNTADERIPHLMACPAAVRFLSCEPLLEDIDLSGQFLMQKARGIRRVAAGQHPADASLVKHPSIDWVIVGGESSAKARPCNVAWIRDIVDQCKAADVPVFVKQLGAKIIVRNDTAMEWPNCGDGWIDREPDRQVRYQGEEMTIGLADPKGGEMAEWPEDLRVRELPKGVRA